MNIKFFLLFTLTLWALSSETLNTILGIVAIVLWGTTIAFARSLTEQIGPITSVSLIYLIGGTFGCGYLIARGKLRENFTSLNPQYLLGCGGLFVLYMVCFYLAIGLATNRSQVLEVGLVNYLWPMLTLLVSVQILKMRASIFLVPGAIVATTGVFLATTQNQPISWQSFQTNLTQNCTPYILALIAAVSWALYSTLSRKWAGDADNGAVSVFMLATGVILGLARLFSPEQTNWTGRAVLELFYMAIGPNLAYVFWERAMRKGDIILVASCSYLTPFLSTVISCCYLGVLAGVKLWVGCVLIIAGAIVCKLSVKEETTIAA